MLENPLAAVTTARARTNLGLYDEARTQAEEARGEHGQRELDLGIKDVFGLTIPVADGSGGHEAHGHHRSAER